MPQLAPLNWMFLFVMFWSMVFFVSIFIWWMNGKKYYVVGSSMGSEKMSLNKWMW